MAIPPESMIEGEPRSSDEDQATAATRSRSIDHESTENDEPLIDATAIDVLRPSNSEEVELKDV